MVGATKYYDYDGEKLTVSMIHKLRSDVSKSWIRKELEKGTSVYDVLNKPVLSLKARAKRGRKKSNWG